MFELWRCTIFAVIRNAGNALESFQAPPGPGWISFHYDPFSIFVSCHAEKDIKHVPNRFALAHQLTTRLRVFSSTGIPNRLQAGILNPWVDPDWIAQAPRLSQIPVDSCDLITSQAFLFAWNLCMILPKKFGSSIKSWFSILYRSCAHGCLPVLPVHHLFFFQSFLSQAEFEDFFTRGRSEARPPAPPLPPAAPAPAPPAPPALGQAFAVEVPGGQRPIFKHAVQMVQRDDIQCCRWYRRLYI